MVKYRIKYPYKNHALVFGERLEFGLIKNPLKIEWDFEGIDYCLEWKKENRPCDVFLNSQFILILYFVENRSYPHPYNLVLYNLKKEVIKIIPTPKRPNQVTSNMPVRYLGGIKVIDDKKYIRVYKESGDSDTGYQETHYLDIESFEFHPSKYEMLETTRGKF